MMFDQHEVILSDGTNELKASPPGRYGLAKGVATPQRKNEILELFQNWRRRSGGRLCRRAPQRSIKHEAKLHTSSVG